MFRSTEQVICCYDGDRAGRDAAWRALENALPYLEDGRQIKFIFLPDGEDPDTYIRQYGKEKFEEYIDQAQSLTEFLFAHLSPQVDFSTQEGRGNSSAGGAFNSSNPWRYAASIIAKYVGTKLGIFDQSQLESLIPNQIDKAEPKPKTPQNH